MADPEDALRVAPRRARARCRASARGVGAPAPQPRAVARRGADRRHRMAAERGSAMFSRIAPRRPRPRPRPRPRGRSAVPPPDRLQPLLVEDHVEGRAQPVEVVRRGACRRRAGSSARARPRPPVPEGARGAAPAPPPPRAWKVKASPAASSAPSGRRRPSRRRPRRPFEGAQPRLAMQSTARSAGVRPRRSPPAGRRCRSAPTRRCRSAPRGPPASVAAVRAAAPPSGRIDARRRKPKSITSTSTPIRRAISAQPSPNARSRRRAPCAGRQELAVAASQAGVAVADVDRDRPVGRATRPQVRDDVGDLDQLALVDVRRRAMHCLQHPVGDDRGAWHDEEVAAARKGHVEGSGGRGHDTTGRTRGGGNAEFRLVGGPGRVLVRPAAGPRRPCPRTPPMPDAPHRPPRRPGGGSGATGWRRSGGCSPSRSLMSWRRRRRLRRLLQAHPAGDVRLPGDSPRVIWWGPLGVIGLSCANAVGQYFKRDHRQPRHQPDGDRAAQDHVRAAGRHRPRAAAGRGARRPRRALLLRHRAGRQRGPGDRSAASPAS